MADSPICSIPNCGKPSLHRGWCSAHYKRWTRHGDPLAGRVADGELNRFVYEVAVPYKGDDCILWPYGKTPGGYGLMNINGRKRVVSNFLCEHCHGPAPSQRHEAAHSCGNGHRGCCNPQHIRWATRSENQLERALHGTSNRGERHGRGKLVESEVREIRNARGTATSAELAKRYSVGPKQIQAIWQGVNWAWLE